MKWHYDVTGAEAIVKDLAFYGDGSTDVVIGVPLTRAAIATPINKFANQTAAAAVCQNIVGVSNEAYDASAFLSGINQPLGPLGGGDNRPGVSAATLNTTGVTNYLKTIINPYAIYLAEYSQLTADQGTETAGSATGKVVTDTFEENTEGDWIVFTGLGSTTGDGNVFQIGTSTSTTSVTAVTSYDDNLNATTTSSRFIRVAAPYSQTVAAGSIDLAANLADLSGLPDAGSAAILPIQSYITDRNHALEPLKVEYHSGIVFDAATLRVYSDILLTDHMMIAPTVVT